MNAKEFVADKLRGLRISTDEGLMRHMQMPIFSILEEGKYLSNLVEEYAQLKAIEFGDWLNDNGYWKDDIGTWYHQLNAKKLLIADIYQTFKKGEPDAKAM